MPLIEARGIQKAYAMGDVTVDVLSGIDLEVDAGEFVTLYGPSGSGKTTLLNIIAGIDRADAGSVRVGDLEVTAASARQLATYRRDAVGYVFQFYNLVPTLTALENVELALELQSRKDLGEAAAVLEQVGLADKANRFPSQLSGGEQQRVAVARALVKRPLLLAGDEPTGNLDATTSQGVIDLLRGLNAEGMTILLATHDPTLGGAARVLELRDGKLEER